LRGAGWCWLWVWVNGDRQETRGSKKEGMCLAGVGWCAVCVAAVHDGMTAGACPPPARPPPPCSTCTLAPSIHVQTIITSLSPLASTPTGLLPFFLSLSSPTTTPRVHFLPPTSAHTTPPPPLLPPPCRSPIATTSPYSAPLHPPAWRPHPLPPPPARLTDSHHSSVARRNSTPTTIMSSASRWAPVEDSRRCVTACAL
jgi:hypothetical protein